MHVCVCVYLCVYIYIYIYMNKKKDSFLKFFCAINFLIGLKYF